jgi:hypothetical protein
MSTLTISQLNNFLALIAEPKAKPVSSSHGEGWQRPGSYIVLGHNLYPIGTFNWFPKGLTEIRMNLKFFAIAPRPKLWGISLEHDEAAVRAPTLWDRKLVLESTSQSQFHAVLGIEIRHVSYVPLRGNFLMENSLVFQAKEGMELYFYTDGSQGGIVAYVTGIESLQEEDISILPGDVHDSQRFVRDELSNLE